MTRRFAWLSLSLLLPFAAQPARAQAAPAPASAPPPAVLPDPAAPPPPIVDPIARHLFLQMLKAQLALRSFVVTIEAHDQTGSSADRGSQTESRIALAVPARAAVSASQGGKVVGEVFSDGASLTVVDGRRKEYREDALSAASAPGIVSARIVALGLLPQCYAAPVSLAPLLRAPGLVAVARGTVAGPVNGVAVDSVVARIIGGDTSQGTFTFVMGQGDHLLREVIVQQAPPPDAPKSARPTTHTETVTALQINPDLPASAFAYTPGKGFKKLAATP